MILWNGDERDEKRTIRDEIMVEKMIDEIVMKGTVWDEVMMIKRDWMKWWWKNDMGWNGDGKRMIRDEIVLEKW